jgi:hypothetical protein
MKNIADRFTEVKENHDLPDSLVDLDFEALTDDFKVVKEMAEDFTALSKTPNFPQELMGLDFEALKGTFQGMEEKAAKIKDMPVQDKFKDMNFTDYNEPIRILKWASDQMDILPGTHF